MRESRRDILSIALIATALIPPVALPLFWLFDGALHGLLGVRSSSSNLTVPAVELLKPMYLGLGPPAAVTGLAIGAWRARTGDVSLGVAAVAGVAASTVQLLILMTLWPDTDPPELPYRAMEIALIAAFTLPSVVLAALIRAIDRSRLPRREL